MKPLCLPTLLALTALATTALPSQAQTALSHLELVGAAVAGQPSKLVIHSGADPSKWCGLAMDFGDGEVREIRIKAAPQGFPMAVDKTYTAAGSYTVKVVGKKVTSHWPCVGAELRLAVQVAPSGLGPAIATAPAPLAAAPAPLAPAPLAPAPLAPAPAPVAADAGKALDSERCPVTVPVVNAAGVQVQFGLRQMVANAGGVQAAKEQVAKRLIDSLEQALDDKLPATEREAAKAYAVTMKSVQEKLGLCR